MWPPRQPYAGGADLLQEDDGLKQPWSGRAVYINPPYSGTAKFVAKARRSWCDGACKTVLLLLQTQTHHRWFHSEVVGHADVFFLNGRVSFYRPGHQTGPAPFGNKFVAYGFNEPMIGRMLCEFDCVHLPKGARVGRIGVVPMVRDAETRAPYDQQG